jgi:trigger factor
MSNGSLRVSTASPSQWGRVLSIEVPRQRFDALRAEVVRDLRRRIARPGFRKGHVPAAIVERDFAARIESTTLEKFIPDVCREAIRQESLDVISSPEVQNLVLDDPSVVRLDLAVEVRPRVALRPLDGLRGRRWTAVVGDEHIDRTLADVREQHAQYVDVEREARDGDVVLVGYVPLDAEGRERSAQRVENYPLRLGAVGGLAEFEAAVRGRQAGDVARPEVRYPEDHGDASVAGKTVAFVLTVQVVKEKRLPDLDELARELGFETLAALRDRIRADLEQRVRDESERDLRESLVDALIQANPLEAPHSMVEQFLELVLADWDERHRRAGQTPDPERRQELARAAHPGAERAAKRAVLLECVAREHGCAVSEEDVDKWIEDKVQAGGSGASEMRAYFADARRRRRLRGELQDDRVFEFLKSKAEIVEEQRPAAVPDAG